MSQISDILENAIMAYDAELLSILLIDRSKTSFCGETHNILWATDNYTKLGTGYQEWNEITIPSITDANGMVLQPRVNKSREEQAQVQNLSIIYLLI